MLDILDEHFDITDTLTERLAKQAVDFQDMHAHNLFKRNMLPFDAEHADPKKLEELGYVVDIQQEHRGNCTHYKMRLLKVVDAEEYSVKFRVEIV